MTISYSANLDCLLSCGGPLKAVVMTKQVTNALLKWLMRRAAQSGRYDNLPLSR